MNIYEIKFWTTIFIDEEEHEILEGLSDDELKEKLKSPSVHAERSDGKFHVGAYNLGKAFIEAYEFLDESIGEDQYNIISVREKENIMIMNWPDDGKECQCLTCRTERADKEDCLKFKHSCGFEIEVIESDWESMLCPECGKEILRDRIVGKFGNYLFLDIDNPKKENKRRGRPKKSDENTL